MNLFSELKPRIDTFLAVREQILDTVKLPQGYEELNFGSPPFAIDDGTNYYAVIDEDGKLSPLPFGYQVSDEDMETVGVDVVLSRPMSTPVDGMQVIRYVPLVEDYQAPGERAFCLETAEDSEVWETMGGIVDGMQQIVNDKAVFNFNQRLSNALVALYEGYDALESVDQGIAALSLDSSVLLTLFLRSHQHAIDTIEEEISNGEDE